MASGRKSREATVNPISDYLVETSTMASFMVERGAYKDGKQLRPSVMKEVPYSFVAPVERTSWSEKDINALVRDVVRYKGAMGFIDDLAFGLERRGKYALSQGLDPSVTEKQRKQIESVRTLISDGLLDAATASGILSQAGLSADQISRYLV